MRDKSLKDILEQLSQSVFFKKKFDKQIKSKKDAQDMRGEVKNIELYLKAIESKIVEIENNIRADTSFFLNKTNFHIEDPENYMLLLDYFCVSTKKRKIEKISTLESEFQELVRTFRKKNYADRKTLVKYLEYTCLGGQTLDIDATCGKVAPSSSQHYDLQRVSLEVFLGQFEIFKHAEEALSEMLNDYKEKINLMTTLSMKCLNKYDGNWDELIAEEVRKKDEKIIQKSTENLKYEITLCHAMQKIEDTYNVKIQLMFQAYKEYLEPKK